MAWSVDGRTIVFIRYRESAIGPAGLYAYPLSGGAPKFVAPRDFFGPYSASISSDQSLIAINYAASILFADLDSGELTEKFRTENGATYPDFSPRDSRLVYSRVFLDRIQPVDSGGIHVFNPLTGHDRPLWRGEPVFGRSPRWSPDAAWIAYVELTQRLVVVDTTGLQRRVLHQTSSGDIDRLQWWRPFPPSRSHPRPPMAVVFAVGRETWFAWLDGGPARRFFVQLGPRDKLSPDGTKLLMVAPSATDSFQVLYMRDLTNLDLPPRQLTRWEPVR